MKQQTSKLRRAGLLAVVCAVVMAALACALALPVGAVADEATVVAHSGEGAQRVNYTSIDDAMNAGYNGATIVMDVDWATGTSSFWTKRGIEVAEGKKLTIDMNGHRITNGVASATIVVTKGAELTLTSSAQAEFEYDGYNADDGSRGTFKVTSGGLVNQTPGTLCTCVEVKRSAKLTLDGVTIAGGEGVTGDMNVNCGGGVTMGEGSTLTMKNGAIIEHCKTGKEGGGVYAEGKGITVNMEGSSIRNNYGEVRGGGIHFKSPESHLNMSAGSSIEGNSSAAGGGVYVGSCHVHH